MDSVSDVSSEEELLRLRNEGRISEAEYRDLLGAMKRQPPSDDQVGVPESDEAASKRKYGKIAFCLLLAGIVLPMVSFLDCFLISGGGEGDVIFSGCLWLCMLLETLAFVFGVVSWPDVLGKTTVATVSAMAALALLFAR